MLAELPNQHKSVGKNREASSSKGSASAMVITHAHPDIS